MSMQPSALVTGRYVLLTADVRVRLTLYLTTRPGVVDGHSPEKCKWDVRQHVRLAGLVAGERLAIAVFIGNLISLTFALITRRPTAATIPIPSANNSGAATADPPPAALCQLFRITCAFSLYLLLASLKREESQSLVLRNNGFGRRGLDHWPFSAVGAKWPASYPCAKYCGHDLGV